MRDARPQRGTIGARPDEAARARQAPPAGGGKEARHAAIRAVVREHAVGTQEELGRLLEARGFRVTQGTLSRDLAQLGALRVARQGGGATYELAPAEPAPAGQYLRELAELVVSLSDNAALCVVRTQPGAANAVARAIDLARIPTCLGTIAGDDTIFATPVRGTSSRRLTHTLKGLLGQG